MLHSFVSLKIQSVSRQSVERRSTAGSFFDVAIGRACSWTNIELLLVLGIFKQNISTLNHGILDGSWEHSESQNDPQ